MMHIICIYKRFKTISELNSRLNFYNNCTKLNVYVFLACHKAFKKNKSGIRWHFIIRLFVTYFCKNSFS